MATTAVGSSVSVPNTTASTSTTSGATGISSPGLGSGLDVTGIVTKLMTVESQPLVQLNARQASYQAKISAYGSLQSALSSLQTAAQTLGNPSTFKGAAAAVSDATVLGATASSSATAGTYNVVVTSLAKAHILDTTNNAYTTSTVFNSGTLAITVAGTTTNVKIDATNNTLSGVAAAINKAGAGVTASVINDGTATRLVISAAKTGTANAITSITATEDGVVTGQSALSGLASASMGVVQAAANAAFSVNGLQITRSSNTVDDVISGVTLNLLKADALGGASSTITVAADTNAQKAAINAFVTAYNSVVTSIHSLTAYDAVNNQASTLTGDSTVYTIQHQLNAEVFRNVSGVKGLSNLTDLGVTLQKDGTLTVNSATLQAALTDSTKDVASLFTQSTTGKQGIGLDFNTMLGNIAGAGGLLATAQDGANRSIADIKSQIALWNTRLAQIQKNYFAQFNALDTMLASMQQTSTYLAQQLANLPGINSTKTG